MSTGVAVWLAACSTPRAPEPARVPAPPPPPVQPAAVPAPPPSVAAASPAPAPAATAKRAPRRVALAPPPPVRSLEQAKRQAAQRLVEAHPDEAQRDKSQFNILAAVTLQVELKSDGSIRRIDVLRRPSQAGYTVDEAIAAVRRAAPFGDVSSAPQPWTFVETLLFQHDGRFKPRSLD